MLRQPVLTPALTGRSVGNIKSHNLRAILLTLLGGGAQSRVRLAQATGLSTTTITNLVNELMLQGIVSESEPDVAADPFDMPGRPSGRPATPIALVPGSRCALGIHFGVDTLRAGMVDLLGNLSACRMIHHPADVPAMDVLDQAVELARSVLESERVVPESLVGIGVGASGLVDPDTGVNVLAPNLGWRDVPLAEVFGDRLGLPVLVDNNVRAMALAESMFGLGRGVNTLAFVYGRVGLGAGFVVGGQIYRGTRAGAGEIGHTTVIPVDGAACRCGNTGCLETLVSETVIVRRALILAAQQPGSILAARLRDALAPEQVGGAPEQRDGAAAHDGAAIEAVFAAARAGDCEALALIEGCAQHMGTALANLVNLINPDMIVLGGLFASGKDLMLPVIEETMHRRSFAGLGRAVTLCVSEFGPNVGVVGAAALALDAFFYKQDM